MKKNYLLLALVFVATQLYFLQNTKAQTWHALASGIGTGANDPFSIVNAMCSSNGNLYVGGQFNIAGENSANNIAVWNGIGWSALSSGIGAGDSNAVVFALTEYNGNLYAAGAFKTAGETTAYNIAEWNGNAWSALGLGIDTDANGSPAQVSALAVYNGKLYVAGWFTTAGGHTVNNIATWDGSNWSAVGQGLGTNEHLVTPISALAVYNGNLYAGGVFDSADDVPANNIAQWNGATWSPVGSGINAQGEIFALAVYDSALYVAGYLDSAGNAPAKSIAKWNGMAWSTVGSGIGDSTSTVTALAESNGILYAGGDFLTVGSVASNNIAQWNGTAWTALSSGVDGGIYAMSIYNGNLYAGGFFNSAGGHAAYNIAEWETTTGINEINNKDGISIYPNPTKGSVTFAIQDAAAGQLQIYDITGAKVYQSAITSPKTMVNLNQEAPGPYLYRVISSDGELISSGKIIIQ